MENFSISDPWVWAILGVALLVLEIFTQVFVMLFFAVAAFVVALCAWQFGLTTLLYQILLFSIVGTLGLLTFRKKVVATFSKSTQGEFKIDQDSVFTLDESIPAKGTARVTYHGSPWTAVNETETPLASGTRVRVVRTEGVKLFVQSI